MQTNPNVSRFHLGARRPKPRLTPEARERQRDGQYKGLLHAAQNRKADNSANYATNFKHGQMASDLERSAEAAGESRKELRGHFTLLDRTLLALCGFFPRIAQALFGVVSRSSFENPLTPGPDQDPRLPLHTGAASPRAPKLVRALALLLWRPLRVYGNQENWERLAICHLLQKVKGWRLQHDELTVERVEDVRWELETILDTCNRCVEPRLKRIEKRFWKVWRVYRGLVGMAEAVFGARDTELPIAKPRHDNRQSKIENRQSLVQFRGTPHYEQFDPTWLDRIDHLSPEAIGNPFQSPSHAMKAQERRSQSAAIMDPQRWQERPPKPQLPEMEPSKPSASEFFRTPSERELRRLVRRGELKASGSFEEFVELVEMALGARASRPQQAQSATAGETPALPGYLYSLAESLWKRMNVFSPRVAGLRELLEATLVWEPKRFLRLWLKLLSVEYGYDAVDFFRRTHGARREDVAWGDDETTPPWREGKLRPAERPGSEAEGRKVHAGELQRALRIWFHAVWYALVPALRASHKVTVALYEWAVSRFGIREEFLNWRPNLSPEQLDSRSERPEWARRVVTVTGKTLVKLRDGQVLEPEV